MMGQKCTERVVPMRGQKCTERVVAMMRQKCTEARNKRDSDVRNGRDMVAMWSRKRPSNDPRITHKNNSKMQLLKYNY